MRFLLVHVHLYKPREGSEVPCSQDLSSALAPWRSGKGCVLLGLHGFERLDRHHRISTFGRLGRHVRQDCLLFGVECREGGLVQSRILRLESCETNVSTSSASSHRLERDNTASQEHEQSRDDSLANKLEKRSYESN